MSDNKIQPLDVKSYKSLMERLASKGECHGKSATVSAVNFKNLQIETVTQTGRSEVVKDIEVTPYYLVMDVDQYPTKETQKALIAELLEKYNDDLFNDHENGEPHLIVSGAWVVKKSSFEDDYKPTQDNPNLFEPDPNAFRICLTTNTDIGLPTTWDPSFTVETGGTVAIRSRDLPALVEALKQIDNGEILARDALMNSDGTSKFDVYGMEPKFLENNYAPAPMPTAAVDTQSNYAAHINARPTVKPDYWANHSSVDINTHADNLGIGIHTYPTAPYGEGSIAYDEVGVPAHADEKIIATTGRLDSNASYHNGIRQSDFTATEYGVLSQDIESEKFIVRQFSHWNVGYHLDRSPSLLHVTSERQYETLETATEALEAIEANLQASNTPTVEKFAMPQIIEKVDAQIAGKAAAEKARSLPSKLYTSIFANKATISRDDMIEAQINSDSKYSVSPVNHAGITLTPKPSIKGTALTLQVA